MSESYKQIQGVLDSLLQDREHELVVRADTDSDLLILTTSSDSVGFLVANGRPQESYAAGYNAFKRLYREHHSAWQHRNLSFVVCRAGDSESHDAFYSQIETDVYFCRKYVIHLQADTDSMRRELLRLPFVPLSVGESGVIRRPPSAQTLLQSKNVDAEIAESICVAGKCSAGRLLDQAIDRLSSASGLPAIGSARVDSVVAEKRAIGKIRVKSLVIEAFRAYRKSQKFDLDADVVVLYGPNGLGKTSFFDAIDYVCTGRIGRLCRRRLSPKQFMDLARHLDTSANDGIVTLQYCHDSADHTVSRQVEDWGEAIIDGGRYDRTAVMERLTAARWDESKARVENIERLFRATHLFSQADPELLADLNDDSTLSAELVSRLLALDDYTSGSAKAEATLKLVSSELNSIQKEIIELDTQIALVRSKIVELGDLGEPAKSNEQIPNLANKLFADAERCNVGLTTHIRMEPTAESIRSLRALIEAELGEMQRRRDQLELAMQQLGEIGEARGKLRQCVAEIDTATNDLGAVEAKLREKQDAKRHYGEKLASLRVELNEAEHRLRAFNELRGLQQQTKAANENRASLEEELQHTKSSIEDSEIDLKLISASLDQQKGEESKIQNLLRSHAERVAFLSGVVDGIVVWDSKNNELRLLIASRDAAEKAKGQAISAISSLDNDIARQERELSNLKQQIDELARYRSGLNHLLDEIEKYVEDGRCPTCDTDHGTKEHLLAIIREKKSTRSTDLEDATQRLRQKQHVLQEARDARAGQLANRDTAANTAASLSRNIESLTRWIDEYIERVHAGGLEIVDGFSDLVSEKLAAEQKVMVECEARLKGCQADLSNIVAKESQLQQQNEKEKAEEKRLEGELRKIITSINQIHQDSEALGLSIGMQAEAVASHTADLAAGRDTARNKMAKMNEQISEFDKEIAEIEAQKNSLCSKREIFREDRTRLQKQVSSFENGLSNILQVDYITDDVVQAALSTISEKIGMLGDVKSRCVTLEQAMDSVQRTAVLSEMETSIREYDERKSKLVRRRDDLKAAQRWFGKIRDVLDDNSESAISSYVKALGPIATLIQKRLRAVYGFGGIQLVARKGAIDVQVSRAQENLKPGDYFSDSQKQILMLSLFLSGRLTQTWSGFAPMLLDDPVTHFDDLNAFAFVELIRGITNSRPGERQFFVSTCEDRLFELMMKKLRDNRGGAKFYRFDGIDRNGPIIVEL